MRRVLSLLALALIGLAPAPAFADSLLNLNGTLADGGTFTGTLRIRTQNDPLAQGTVIDGAYSFTLPPNYLGNFLTYPTFANIDAFPVSPPQLNFDLYVIVPTSNIYLYTGGALCAVNTPCSGGAPNSSFSGPNMPQQLFLTLTATAAATPEPGTLTLLGTGLLGTVVRLRHRAAR